MVVPKRRSSFCGLRPGTPIRIQQTTLAWCTSRPAQRSTRASIATTCDYGGRVVAAAPHGSQRLLLVLAEIGGNKEWYLETARTELSGGIGSPSVFRPPSGHPQARWSVPRPHPTQAPHFLPMMVHARVRPICRGNGRGATWTQLNR